jgi:hypothetical protein
MRIRSFFEGPEALTVIDTNQGTVHPGSRAYAIEPVGGEFKHSVGLRGGGRRRYGDGRFHSHHSIFLYAGSASDDLCWGDFSISAFCCGRSEGVDERPRMVEHWPGVDRVWCGRGNPHVQHWYGAGTDRLASLTGAGERFQESIARPASTSAYFTIASTVFSGVRRHHHHGRRPRREIRPGLRRCALRRHYDPHRLRGPGRPELHWPGND